MESGGVYGNINAIGGQSVDKRAAQAAYAAQLKAQQAVAQQMSPTSASQFQAQMQRQVGVSEAGDMFSGIGSFEEHEKMLKRKKQEEYSRALKEQQLLHQQHI